MNGLRIVVAVLLEVFGALWLAIEGSAYFFGDEYAERLRDTWWIVLILGAAVTIYRLWPKRRFSHKVDDRDIVLELVVGDIFKQDGPIIVGSNTQFETSPAVISQRSVQGSFTSRYCSDLRAVTEQVNAQAPTRPVDFGTTVTIRAGNGRVAYFCAIAQLNDAGVARGTLEDLRVALGGLWSYLADNAEKAILNCPILGSGFSRVTASREELVREIVLSFMAAVSESAFCEGLRLVIHPKDVRKYEIDVNELVRFVAYNCRHAVSRSTQPGVGTPEG